MFVIPSRSEKRWIQKNSSDLAGTIQRTRNMDFDTEGYAKLAKRARCIYDLSSIDRRILWIKYFQGTNKYWFMALSSNAVYSVDGTTLAVTDESGTSNIPSPDTTGGRNDCVQWQGYLYATSTATLRRYNSGGWSGNQYAAGLTNGGFMAVHEQKNYLAISQGNQVIQIDTSHALVAGGTLTLPSEQQVTSMDYSNGFYVIGCRNINNGEAKVYLWDGNTAVANSDWGVGASRVDSVRRYKNSFVVLNSLGMLLKFNGAGFDPLDAFPIYYKEADWDVDGSSYLGRVINRGMQVEGELIYINLSPRIVLPAADTANHIFENWFEGGVWCYDPKVGLHHRYPHTSSIRSTETIATASVNTTTDVITVASAPDTGTPIMYCSDATYGSVSGTAIGGLTNRTKYYCIKTSSTTIKLASTKALADAGTAIDLTGTGNNAQILIYLPNRDFGGSTLGGNGINVDAGSAITLVANRELAYRTDAAQVMFGTRIGKAVIAGSYGLAVATFGQENRGILIIPKLQSSVLTENFENVSVKFRGVKTAEDKIIVKYRNIERPDTLTGIDLGLTQTATWVSGTQFTTTALISAAKKGDEVSFHSGSGSGYMAHISSISYSAPTYTVNIDETIQNVTASDTVGFVIENWNKLGTIDVTDDKAMVYFTNDNGDRYISDGGMKTFPIGKPSKWIEIKLEARGEDVKIEEILLNGKPFKTYIN